MPEFVKVLSVSELPAGKGKCVDVKGTAIGVFNVNGLYFAIEDQCTHDLASLADGGINDDCTVECPWHGAQFDLKTGKALTLPAVESVKTFKVRVSGENIEVEV